MDNCTMHLADVEDRTSTPEASAKQKCSFLTKGLQSLPDRSVALLLLLSKDSTFKDGVVAVGSDEIRIHCAIVASLSVFFSTALSGSFAEGRKKRIELGDTTFRAASVVVNFAYAIDVKATLGDDYIFVAEVWKLADRLQVDDLVKICAQHAVSLCDEFEDGIMKHVVQFYILARNSDLKDEASALYLGICVWFGHAMMMTGKLSGS